MTPLYFGFLAGILFTLGTLSLIIGVSMWLFTRHRI
jgi:hypothetical protein